MDLDNQIPVLIRHILEADIAQDAGIVQQHIYSAKGLDGSVDNTVAILDAVIVRNSFASGSSDFVDDHVRCLGCMSVMDMEKMGRQLHTLEELPSPLKEPPRSLTTTFAPRDPKNRAYALPSLTRVRDVEK